MLRWPKKLWFGEVEGFAHLAALGLMWQYTIVRIALLVGLSGIHMARCSERLWREIICPACI